MFPHAKPPEGPMSWLDLRDEFVRMLEIIYEDGLWRPRDIDVAADAFQATVETYLDSHGLSRYNGSQERENNA